MAAERHPLRPLALALVLSLGASACAGDPHAPGESEGMDSSEPDETDAPETTASVVEPVTLRGYLQKGPFVLGTTVLVSRLNASYEPTGEVFVTHVDSDLGDFSVTLPEPMVVSVEGSGYFFDEVTGLLAGPLTLRAVASVDADEADTTLNVFTHLTYERALALAAGGTPLDAAQQQAFDELVDELEIGATSIVIAGNPRDFNMLAGDSLESAYLLLVSAVISESTWNAAELQELLNTMAVRLRTGEGLGGVIEQRFAQAETALRPGEVQDHLAARKQELGLGGPVPKLNLLLDQDHDGIANALDNCREDPNPDQSDEDGDNKGDACDDCLDGEDDDGDGFENTCDTCPDTPGGNKDTDHDGVGDVCDDCPYAPDTGEQLEFCCHPLKQPCASPRFCDLDHDGEFGCWDEFLAGYTPYGESCHYDYQCIGGAACVAAILIPECTDDECCTEWCASEDEDPDCAGVCCIPYYEPGTAPLGFEGLGVRVNIDEGPCAGGDTPGILCTAN